MSKSEHFKIIFVTAVEFIIELFVVLSSSISKDEFTCLCFYFLFKKKNKKLYIVAFTWWLSWNNHWQIFHMASCSCKHSIFCISKERHFTEDWFTRACISFAVLPYNYLYYFDDSDYCNVQLVPLNSTASEKYIQAHLWNLNYTSWWRHIYYYIYYW